MNVQQALVLARAASATVPLPASGATGERWRSLARLAADDLTTARVVEAHLDAVAVLAEAGAAPPADSTWGVFAAEAAGVRLEARLGADGWHLEGAKPWCSLAADLTHALVTAHTPEGRRLFAVDLAAGRAGGSVVVERGTWHSRGLVDVPSGPVHFHGAAARPVGEAGWYLRRPGFAHGGIGVAACWYGGAVGVARALRRTAREPDQLAHHHRGLADLRLRTARLALEAAAVDVDAGRATGRAGEVLATRTRSTVAEVAEDVLRITGHALGPAPLTFDAAHAARVADLTVYLRQDHAERDVAALGEMLAERDHEEGTGWPS
ncbi:alkylation response protein AidB-like acyl-CoA dehydrogenase [Kineococcus radiotolerans]|uniref:Alkylation response protein AidB-like acyl-CoA dehydrogenase n=1 Tax=Kineococcus radiotolerans TaxID=131568 RepID=A0A7W4XWV6_KINRA|nr:acyl-CoA dehydrogenase [Kineococcus radiotolerans]MBB2900525.1 alkylation response protein AidB-like acyl-CoA dehydrogenase [Kineococcus radiotolerans]